MRLLVILASPPVTTGQRTMARLGALPDVLTGAEVRVANLFARPTVDLPSMVTEAAAPDGWVEARAALTEELATCDGLLAGWGLLRLSGPARRHRDDQLQWVIAAAAEAGHDNAWTVGGQPRHPSRWHQYVSDRHGRANGQTFPDRLRQVLVEVPIASLL